MAYADTTSRKEDSWHWLYSSFSYGSMTLTDSYIAPIIALYFHYDNLVRFSENFTKEDWDLGLAALDVRNPWKVMLVAR